MQTENDVYKDMCFVIMPIGEVTGRPDDHFKHVYEDIFKEAISNAGFKPKRADDDKSSSMIQVDIIRDIVKSPMAICDLSTRNPNVLFELGIRQAFDLPVVLVQEEGTPRIFDINTINTINYRKDRIYHEVIEDREKIYAAIMATKDNKKGINSIIKLLEIGKAELKGSDTLSDFDEIKLLLYSLSNELKREKENSISHVTNEITAGKRITIDSSYIEAEAFERDIKFYESVVENGFEYQDQDSVIEGLIILRNSIKKSSVLPTKTKNNYMNRIEIIHNMAMAAKVIV